MLIPLLLTTPMNTGNTKHCNSASAIPTFTYHQIVNRQWDENEDILTLGSEVNGQKRRMGMLSGAQKHPNCFDQGIKCFARYFWLEAVIRLYPVY